MHNICKYKINVFIMLNYLSCSRSQKQLLRVQFEVVTRTSSVRIFIKEKSIFITTFIVHFLYILITNNSKANYFYKNICRMCKFTTAVNLLNEENPPFSDLVLCVIVAGRVGIFIENFIPKRVLGSQQFFRPFFVQINEPTSVFTVVVSSQGSNLRCRGLEGH